MTGVPSSTTTSSGSSSSSSSGVYPAPTLIVILFTLLATYRCFHVPPLHNIPTFVDHEKSFEDAVKKFDFQEKTWSAPVCDVLRPDEVALTLVTQCSMNRLWMMEHHCKRWGTTSPMSLAVHTNESPAFVKDELVRMGCASDQLTVQTMPVDAEQEGKHGAKDFPVNKLRNIALKGIKTSHYLYIDIDFWPSEDLHNILLDSKEVQTKLAEDPKFAIVVPAFQLKKQCRPPSGNAEADMECRLQTIEKMPQKQEDLLLMFATDAITARGLQVDQFDYVNNNAGHGSTIYVTWVDQEAGSVQPIPCFRSRRYEPYFVARYCQDLPPYQEIFTGYGKNKISMLLHMRRAGYHFGQIGGGFLIHYPHRQSTSRKLWGKNNTASEVPVPGWKSILLRTSKSDSSRSGLAESALSKRARVDAIFSIFLSWLKEKIPNESVVPTCMDDMFSIDDDLFAVVD